MKTTLMQTIKKTPHSWAAIALGLLVLITSCTSTSTPTSQSQGQQPEGTMIQIDGSSTVYPLTNEVVQELEAIKPSAIPISVKFSGTGGGFEKFCRGETDVNNASRPITQNEIDLCAKNNVDYIEVPVAYDALTIVVHSDNKWIDSVTLEELRRMWGQEAQSQVKTWKDVRPEWPDAPLNLYGPGADSGTFDYFIEAIGVAASRSDYTASEDDDLLVKEVSQDPNGIGYFGYVYYQENEKILNAVPVDGGQGPVLPSSATVQSGDYQPFSRPLLLYVNARSVTQKPELRAMLEHYLSNGRRLVKIVGYVPLPDSVYALAMERLQNNTTGTVFSNRSAQGIKMEEPLKK